MEEGEGLPGDHSIVTAHPHTCVSIFTYDMLHNERRMLEVGIPSLLSLWSSGNGCDMGWEEAGMTHDLPCVVPSEHSSATPLASCWGATGLRSPGVNPGTVLPLSLAPAGST